MNSLKAHHLNYCFFKKYEYQKKRKRTISFYHNIKNSKRDDPSSSNKKDLIAAAQNSKANYINIEENLEDSITKTERTRSKDERNKIKESIYKLNDSVNNNSENHIQPEIYPIQKLNQTNFNESLNLSLNSDILAFEKLLSSYENFSVDNRVSELSLLEKNKFKIQSLNPVNFNIVLVGESGVGKTSFVKSFMTKLFQSENSEQTSNNQTIAPIQSESKDFQTYTYNSRFEKENFNLEIIDYKGYRQNLKINFWVKKTLSFFKNRFDNYMKNKELDNNSDSVKDTRIHLCIYFIQGPHTKELDYNIIQKLSKYVNVLPVIAKADKLTIEEIKQCKREIFKNFKKYKIRMFAVSEAIKKLCDNQEFLDFLFATQLGPSPPFAIVSDSESLNKEFLNCFSEDCDTLPPDQSDFMRLYYIIRCYIPFECIRKTKQLYKKYKEKRLSLFMKKNKVTQGWRLFYPCFAASFISILWLSRKNN